MSMEELLKENDLPQEPAPEEPEVPAAVEERIPEGSAAPEAGEAVPVEEPETEEL